MMLNMKTQVCAISDYNTSRLIVELETGGNIRLEDGKPSDVWYSSCVDLVNSRFFQQDFQSYGVSDLRVVRVTRIHNRFLRNRFEERLEQLVDTSDGSYKRSLEYLFYGQDPRLPGEILRVAEEGFRAADFYGEIGMEAAVSLSNSLSIADIPRIQDALKKQRIACNPDGTPKMRFGIELGNGQLLITKVFLARCTAEKSSSKTNAETGQDEPEDDLDAQKPLPLNRNSYPKHDSVYRVKPADTKQRTWFVFDHYLVLPEYLVEFEYVMKHKSIPDPPLSFMTELVEKGVLHPQNETEASDMGPLARSLIKFLYQCNLKIQSNRPEEDECTKILNSPPIIPDRSSITMISLDTIMVRCGADLSNVKYLNLHSNSIKKLENLTGLVNLETLILSFNEISKIEGLETFVSLKTLDLSFNLIRRLDNLKTLSTLTSLEVNNNLLYRAEDLSALRKYTPNLIVLNLSNNAVCELKSYRFYVLRRLLKLEMLDGRKVSESERQEALTNTSSIKLNMIKECAFVQRRSTWSLLPQSHRVRTLSDKELVSHGPDDDSWCERVVDLELNHRHLRKLSNLEKLVNLRVLSVCDNEILSLQGLERCTLLEELLMEENRISKIEFLSTLVNLKKLDLGKNKIARIEGLEGLTNIVQLSLEDNEIETLSGLNTLTTLLELYVGNNKVEETKQILQLRPLPKLIIFDLSGNPVATRGDYRLYTIFHLKKLKVLDGLGVESGEQSSANETYSGRLSEEFLVDRLGHSSFGHVSELDLASCKIRDTADCITGAFFPNLRILNLDNNLITDLTGIADLSSLSVLRLNHNRIENLLPEKQRNGSDAPVVPVIAFSSLEVLQLGFNEIHSLASLRLLPLSNLKVLFVQGNDISRIDGLENLTQVRELVLDKNKIRHVEYGAFSPLKNLRELYIEENGLKSLSNFLPLPKLQVLHVGSNRISEMSDIDKLSPLPAVVDLTLANNPVARKQLYRATAIQKLPTLKLLDNKEVTVEERERVDILFTIDARNNSNYPSQAVAQAVANQSAGKVPIKLSSVTFDQLGGGVQSHLPAAQHQGGSAGTASFVCIGLGSKNVDSARSEIDWHPFHNSTGDFFLPAGKISGRPRIGSSSTGSTSDGDQQRDVENWALAAERRASPHSKFAEKARGVGRPRSGDRPGSKVVGIGGIPSGAAAAMASAALEARATAANMNLPGQPRGRKLGFSARARVQTQT
uniref:U2A'/phosphoprotein 32 family A C-terminal domain-containing protein n=1 Tax=Guillardia theta TaxID=55529 RepID=A0A7S4J9U1_GUITH